MMNLILNAVQSVINKKSTGNPDCIGRVYQLITEPIFRHYITELLQLQKFG